MKNGVKVLHKAIDILKEIGSSKVDLSLTEISTKVNLPRSTVQRIVYTLEAESLIEQNPNKIGYKIGPGLGVILHNTQADFINLIRPLLQELSMLLEETVSLSTLLGDKLHVVDVVVYEKHLRVAFPLGLEAPCYATAAGIKLMSILKDEVIDSYVPDICSGLSNRNPTKKDVIKKIKESRDNEVYYDSDSYIEGVCSYAILITCNFGNYAATVFFPKSLESTNHEFIRDKLIELEKEIQYKINFFDGHKLV